MVGSETYPPQIAKKLADYQTTNSVIGDFTWTGWDYMENPVSVFPLYHLARVVFSAQFPRSWHTAATLILPDSAGQCPIIVKLFRTDHNAPTSRTKPKSLRRNAGADPWVLGDRAASWTWPGCDGKPVIVEVYSAGDEVEYFRTVFLLGNSLPEKANDYRAYFEAICRPGTLTAISYEGGQEIGRRGAEIRQRAYKAECACRKYECLHSSTDKGKKESCSTWLSQSLTRRDARLQQ